jgi:hypothetical protein
MDALLLVVRAARSEGPPPLSTKQMQECAKQRVKKVSYIRIYIYKTYRQLHTLATNTFNPFYLRLVCHLTQGM